MLLPFAVRRPFGLALAAAAAAGALALGSCGKSPTGPEQPPTVHRTVTIAVRDSLGNPAAGAEVWITSLFDSAGLVTLMVVETDAQGEIVRVLAEGGWVAWTGGGGTAAGGSFVVPGAGRDPSDTLVVRLVRRASSRATGVAKLAGRTDHRGIWVSCLAAQPFAMTDSTGAYSLEDMPPGRWTVTCSMVGFKLGITEVTVPAPGVTVTVPTVTMISDP